MSGKGFLFACYQCAWGVSLIGRNQAVSREELRGIALVKKEFNVLRQEGWRIFGLFKISVR